MESFGQWKFLFIGMAIGALLTIAIGFGLGGWMTGGGADERGRELAQAEVTAALVPYCTERARRDPNFTAILAQLKTGTPLRGVGIMMKAGWALNPTTGKPDQRLAYACFESLVAKR